jgi:hypothetical protein
MLFFYTPFDLCNLFSFEPLSKHGRHRPWGCDKSDLGTSGQIPACFPIQVAVSKLKFSKNHQ